MTQEQIPMLIRMFITVVTEARKIVIIRFTQANRLISRTDSSQVKITFI